MTNTRTISVMLKVWRQEGPAAKGRLETYEVKDIDTDLSFLEMLDIVNEGLQADGIEPIAFESNCREGICGCCGATINGRPHGPRRGTTLCQLHMRHFKDGDLIVVEPFRATAFPIIKDLVVDRSAFDRIIQAGGYVSVRTGQAPDAHTVPVPKDVAEQAFRAAACIGCGACTAACPNASASLFMSAKVAQLAKLPQGHPERKKRVRAMASQMDKDGFGSCGKYHECHAVCPKQISVDGISTMKREYLLALLAFPPENLSRKE
jgi:succinate dehydrogenase / fumarate reductase, iron-sulfur subunit